MIGLVVISLLLLNASLQIFSLLILELSSSPTWEQAKPLVRFGLPISLCVNFLGYAVLLFVL